MNNEGQLGIGGPWVDSPQSVTNWDETPPSGSVTINGGAADTPFTETTLSLTCSDTSQCVSMQFSNDQLVWSNVESYVGSKTWTLSPGFGEKTVYVRLTDSSGNTALYLDTIALIDNAPPIGSVFINNGASNTNSRNATLTLSCEDSSGCTSMAFSNDQSTWSNVESFGTSKSWTLSTGDGTKTVYTRFTDAAGNDSDVYSASITLDTTNPVASVSINGGAASTNSRDVTLTLNCEDSNGCASMAFSNDQSTWSNAESFGTSKSWSLSTGDGAKTVYVRFTDGAGNISTVYSSTITVAETTTTIDTTPPSGSVIINGGANSTNNPRVTLTLSCTDSSGCTSMAFSNDQLTWSDAEGYTRNKSWNLTSGVGNKTIYVRFTDAAGNVSTLHSAHITFSLVDSNETSIGESGGGVMGLVILLALLGGLWRRCLCMNSKHLA